MVGEATFYHPSLEGNLMRNGEVYDSTDYSIAAIGVSGSNIQNSLASIGDILLICRENCIIVKVQDTGRFPESHIDLSQAGFEQLGRLPEGRIPIIWWNLSSILAVSH